MLCGWENSGKNYIYMLCVGCFMLSMLLYALMLAYNKEIRMMRNDKHNKINMKEQV